GLITQALHHLRQPQCVEALDLPGNRSKYRTDRAPLIEEIAAKARQILQAKREIQLQIFLKAMLLGVGQDAIGQRLSIRGGKRRHIEGPQFAVDANSRRTIRGYMEITPPHFDHLLEKFA